MNAYYGGATANSLLEFADIDRDSFLVGLRKMRNIILSVTISIAACVLLYLIATGVGLPADLAKGMAGFAALSTKDVHEFFETRRAKRALFDYNSVPALNDFSIRTSSIVVMASVMFVGMRAAAAALEAIIIFTALIISSISRNSAEFEMTSIFWLAFLNAMIIQTLSAFYIGKWIGVRSNNHGFIIAIGSAFLGWSMSILISVLYDEMIVGTILPQVPAVSDRVMYMVLGLPAPIFMAVGALGVRSGRRQRLTRYLAFILNLLPEGTRQTVVEIAKDEAIQISQTRGADGCDFLHGSVSGQLSTIAEHPVDAR